MARLGFWPGRQAGEQPLSSFVSPIIWGIVGEMGEEKGAFHSDLKVEVFTGPRQMSNGE